MSLSASLRLAARSVAAPRTATFRPATSLRIRSLALHSQTSSFSTTTRLSAAPDPHDPHHEESFEEFSAR